MHALYLILVESFDETWDVKDEKERKRVGGIVIAYLLYCGFIRYDP
jgi:hypothetical protein